MNDIKIPTPKKNETVVRLYAEAQVFEGSRPSGLLIQGADEICRLESELAAVTEQRDEWKAKYIQQNKDLGCEMMDPNGTIWDYAKKLQTELAAVTEDHKKIEDKLRADLRGHPDSELWGESGLIAATMRCVEAFDTLTEQLDEARDTIAMLTNTLRNNNDAARAGYEELECELAAVTKERDEALKDLEFRRDLYTLQTKQLNDVREQRDRLAEALRNAERTCADD